MWQKFKEFAFKGNVLDMAVGVVIGAAFKDIVTKLVDCIIMPLIGIITGGNNLSALSFNVRDAVVQYGAFLQAILDFFIIAASIFVMITAIGKFRETAEKLRHKEEEEALAAAPPAPTEAELLAEIRDLLKDKK
ncbi:MAG: large conductance mechanosensitive channel protein MscL [Clostridia bacterium]|nr:large conductance mechanosensitive channel protein MscL [Clostridia bacterium]